MNRLSTTAATAVIALTAASGPASGDEAATRSIVERALET